MLTHYVKYFVVFWLFYLVLMAVGLLFTDAAFNHLQVNVGSLVATTSDVADDRLIYEETDPGFFMSVGGSRLNDWIMISIGDHETSEYRLLPAADPFAEPIVVSPRETGLEYEIEEGGDVFFILTNADGAKDYKVVTAPVADPRRANWTDLVAHEPGRLILSIQAFRNFLVRLERKDGLPRIVVRERAGGAEHVIAFDEEAYSLGLSGLYEYDSLQAPVQANNGVQQGYLEGSNVDSLQELVQMILVQRSFAATQRALTGVGQMQSSLINNMLR